MNAGASWKKKQTIFEYAKTKNKAADQLSCNCTADQRLCFRSMGRKIPRLFKSEISSFQLASVAVQLDLCRTWSEAPNTGFLALQLNGHVVVCDLS